MIKKVLLSSTKKLKHWVGNGFHVHGLLRASEEINSIISPFIMIDYASPKEFSKSKVLKGVGEHPHRGFETVTIAYHGEIQHRDSSGGGGLIKPGDVQWMTAGSGIVHDEFHSVNFSNSGGIFEMLQLWVNLPKKLKMTPPKYQSIKKEDIPNIKLTDEINIRLIAGNFLNKSGPAKTFTKINIMDFYGKNKSQISLKIEEKINTILVILSGNIQVDSKSYKDKSVIVFDQLGTNLSFKTSKNFKALLLTGEPIDEPLVAHGPFVMNTEQEIDQAIKDYQNGKMGNLL
jgi:redox-sensitive bicupin YhaK (pirin superfamily)